MLKMFYPLVLKFFSSLTLCNSTTYLKTLEGAAAMLIFLKGAAAMLKMFYPLMLILFYKSKLDKWTISLLA